MAKMSHDSLDNMTGIAKHLYAHSHVQKRALHVVQRQTVFTL